MKDYLSNDLQVGDDILFIHGANLVLSKIIKFTKEGVYVLAEARMIHPIYQYLHYDLRNIIDIKNLCSVYKQIPSNRIIKIGATIGIDQDLSTIPSKQKVFNKLKNEQKL